MRNSSEYFIKQILIKLSDSVFPTRTTIVGNTLSMALNTVH